MTDRIVALALIVALAFVTTERAAAGEPVTRLSISSVTIPLGQEEVVELRASVLEPPGPGAWTIDVQYDPSIASSVDCEGFSGTMCGRQYAVDMDRLTGTSADGLVGDTLLAIITYQCGDHAGTSPLTILVSVLAYASVDFGQITPVVQNGEVLCAEPTPTEELAPTATIAARVLPETGTGYRPSRENGGWVPVALTIAAAIAVGAGTLMARRR